MGDPSIIPCRRKNLDAAAQIGFDVEKDALPAAASGSPQDPCHPGECQTYGTLDLADQCGPKASGECAKSEGAKWDICLLQLPPLANFGVR